MKKLVFKWLFRIIASYVAPAVTGYYSATVILSDKPSMFDWGMFVVSGIITIGGFVIDTRRIYGCSKSNY